VSDLQDAVLEVKDVVESLDGIPGSTWTKSQIERRWDRGWKWIFEKQGSGTEVNEAVTPRFVFGSADLCPSSFLN